MPIGPTSDQEVSMVALPDRADYEKFFTAYGECFSAWSGVEVNLLLIFVFLLKSSDYDPAASAFYSTTGFRAKLDMVDAVVKSSKQVDESALKRWCEIHQTARRASQRRNQLAHDTVYYGRQFEREDRKLFIGDPRTPFSSARLYVHDLKNIREAFSTLSTELFAFWQRLSLTAKKA